MENNSEKLKLSSFSHIFIKGDNVAVYNSLNHKVFYSDKSLLDFLNKFENPNIFDENSTHIKKLVKAGILVPENFDINVPLIKIRNIIAKPNIDSLYIVTTDKCNYACKYCFVEENIPSGYRFTSMAGGVLKRGIDLFAHLQLNNGNRESEVIFYGGEPLLNKNMIFLGTEYLNEKVDTGEIKKLNKMIFTNGSLVTRDVAKFFYEQKISVGISIDGWKEIHDKMRVYSATNKGTFESTIKGYKNLKRAGCHIGISCTVSSHNIDVLDKVIEYFATELEGKFISLNPLFDISNKEKITKEFLEHMADKIIEAYDIAKQYGIYEDRVTKFIEPFVKGFIRVVDCTGCGRQMVLSPDGQIGTCHAFLGNKKFFCGSVYSNKFDPNKNKVFVEWSKRSPFNMPQCQNCPALSICGGGCPYNAYVRKGSIWALDDRICYLAKGILEKIIWEGFENVKRKNKREGPNKTSEKKLRHFGC